MKKIVTLLLLCIISFLFVGETYAIENVDKKKITKNLILAKKNLEKQVHKGKNYIIALDAYFEKYKNDTTRIEALIDKVSTGKKKLGGSKKEQELKYILEYIEYKAYLVHAEIPKKIVVSENHNDIYDLNADQVEQYIVKLPTQELENLVNNLYKDDGKSSSELINIYKLQIEKAKDITRIYDLKAIQSAIEQTYQDTAEYPTQEDFTTKIKPYIFKIPQDSLAGYTINNCNFGYKYEVGRDKNGIDNGNYRLSTCFENSENITKRAHNSLDNGVDNLKYEFGYWDQNTVFTESFYINNITKWKKYVPSSGSLDEESRREAFYHAIFLKYLENNPEILENYSRDAQNAKISSDLRTLASMIETGITTGKFQLSEIIGIHIIKKTGENWESRVGYPNYKALGINKEDYLDSRGNEYIFGYTQLGKHEYYELLGFSENDDKRFRSNIKGNYISMYDVSPPSLFENRDSGEPLKRYEEFTQIPNIGANDFSADIKESQRISKEKQEEINVQTLKNMNMINKLIQEKLDTGEIHAKDIIGTLSSSTLTEERDSGFGILDYERLGISEEQARHSGGGHFFAVYMKYTPYGDEYYYQLLGYTAIDRKYTTIIKGNYIKKDDTYIDSLFRYKNTGKPMRNGDVSDYNTGLFYSAK